MTEGGVMKVPELPAPPEDFESTQSDECRIWIGNLDLRINEFTMLKLLQKYGSLKHFDFLYHKTGPDQGKPRGYCFATYCTQQEAEKAQKGLNGKMALSKKLVVKQARPQTDSTAVEASRPYLMSAAKEVKEKASSTGGSTVAQIKAIEAKLQQMEKGESSIAPGAVAQELAHSYGHAPTNANTQKPTTSSKRSHKEFSYKRQRHSYNRPKHRR